MQKAYHPMRAGQQHISCYYNEGLHKQCSQGKPADYPTDFNGHDTGRDWAYAPVDMEVLRRYTTASHYIWLRSTDKVDTPSGEKYLYLMCCHQDNSEMANVGHIYKQGTKLFREGKNGRATGYHLHMSFGISDEKKPLGSNKGWKCNTKSGWVMYIPGVTNVKLEEAIYTDEAVYPNHAQVEKPPFTVGNIYKLKEAMNVRASASTSGKLLREMSKGKTIKCIACKEDNKGAWWVEISDGQWVCGKGSTGKKFLS